MSAVVIDLNDVQPMRPDQDRYDIDLIVGRLRESAESAESWVQQLFPNGKRVGDDWRLANIRGDAPRKSGSCVITLKGPHAGDWIDFDGNEGGGPINAIEQATGLSGRALLDHAAKLAGVSAGNVVRKTTDIKVKAKATAAQEIQFIRQNTHPITGTHAEDYLRKRGLEAGDVTDLLFHPNLTHWETKTGFPAMIGVVRNVAGEVTGLHRTYLNPDRPQKAAVKKPKMMLGKVAGGAVQLRPADESGVLVLCEGIESALALCDLTPALPVWATLSTKGMEQIRLPDGVRDITIFADNDESGAGLRAARRLTARLQAEERKVRIALPPETGTDANDLLLRGGQDALQSAFDQEWQEEQDSDFDPASAAHEDAIATAFSQRFENYLRYDHHRGRWYLWDEAHWKLEETGLAQQFAREECRRAVNALALDDGDAAKIMRASTSAAIIRFAQIDRHHAVTSEIWDPDQFALGTPGGTVNLRSGLLRPAERRDYVTRLTSVAPIAAANCPTWLRFLDDATQGDAGLVRFLQQISGYCLTGDTREHALFFIYGPGGNGKSVFLNTLNGILANYAETAVMDAFTASAHDKHSTDIAMLRGARLVSVSETEEGRAWAETRVKQLTGGDKVTARFMRQDNFTFIPRFKLVIVGNHKPVLSNVDDAAKRRFNIIPFTCKPPRPDKQLEIKLQTEWPGILRWMINGCLDWQKNGLVRPRIVSEATAEYFDDQDTFGQWLEECCLQEKREFETTAKLFQSWKSYAERQGDRPGSSKSFSAILTRRGFEASRKRIYGTQHRIFFGLSLRFDPQASGINHD